jgi:hypothetical protein
MIYKIHWTRGVGVSKTYFVESSSPYSALGLIDYTPEDAEVHIVPQRDVELIQAEGK